MTLPPLPKREDVGLVAPATELGEWALATIVAEDGALHNPDHAHLQHCHLGWLWHARSWVRKGRHIAGTAEQVRPGGSNRWKADRRDEQLREWFGAVPEFVISLHLPTALFGGPAATAALVEHELYHCGQARDEWGTPMFSREGRPLYALRGHDVEEFIGVVRRYGAGAATAGVQRLVEAAQQEPEVLAREARGVCELCAA